MYDTHLMLVSGGLEVPSNICQSEQRTGPSTPVNTLSNREVPQSPFVLPPFKTSMSFTLPSTDNVVHSRRLPRLTAAEAPLLDCRPLKLGPPPPVYVPYYRQSAYASFHRVAAPSGKYPEGRLAKRIASINLREIDEAYGGEVSSAERNFPIGSSCIAAESHSTRQHLASFHVVQPRQI